MFAVPPETIAAVADRAIAHPVRIARELAADRLGCCLLYTSDAADE